VVVEGGFKGGKTNPKGFPPLCLFWFFFYIKKEQIKMRKVGVWKWVFKEIRKINNILPISLHLIISFGVFYRI